MGVMWHSCVCEGGLSVYACMCVCMYVYMYACVCVCVHVHVCVCVCVCVSTYNIQSSRIITIM